MKTPRSPRCCSRNKQSFGQTLCVTAVVMSIGTSLLQHAALGAPSVPAGLLEIRTAAWDTAAIILTASMAWIAKHTPT